ncbi:MAG: heavy-metal-associated domain-containing protein [Pseudomonadota bacterium]
MQTEHLKIAGMTCGGCVSKVTHALESIRGVSDVKVSLDSGEADGGARGGKAKGGCCG